MSVRILPFLIPCLTAALPVCAMTPLYEESQSDRNLSPRSQVVVELGDVQWPRGADRFFVEVWSEDDGEEPFNLVVNSGKGGGGNLKGVHCFSVEELPPKGGGMLLGVGAGELAKNLDLHALSNITVKTESGAACRFGVSRVFTLAKGEKRPEVKSPPRRHPRDAAEHAVDFAAFQTECARGDFVIGQATSMESVRPRAGFKWRKADKVAIRLARGEYESVQILVAPNGHDLNGVHVDVTLDSAFAASNVTSSVVGYTETIHPPPYVLRPLKGGKMKRPPCGWYPDPILDFQKSCNISGTDVQSFWVRVKCPRDQAAGVYEGALVVSAEGAESVRIPFSVRVNGFEVGRVSPLPLAVSVDIPGSSDTNNWRNAWKKRSDDFCDFFADYFITVNCIYWRQPAWGMLERLRDQGRLGLFNLCNMWYMGLDDRSLENFRANTLPALQKLYDKAKELGIEKYAYFYGFDEQGAGVFTNIARTVEELHRAFPGVPVLTTARDNRYGADGSPLAMVDAFCPGTCSFNPSQVERARRDGRKVWWYFTNIPASPIANTMIEGPPCEIRSLMGAQTQKFKPDGFLYWSITRWNWSAREPIAEGPFTTWEPRSYGPWHGDGQWTCCGGPDKMPLATLRLENFRDGVEDLWYVKLLEEKLHAAESRKLKIKSVGGADANASLAIWMQRARKVLAVPDEVARSTATFSVDPDVIYRWRDEMADLIEAAVK